MRAAGLGALAACVLASCWIALGAADGAYLLELPTRANPGWIDGPLQSLSGVLGTLEGSGLSAAVIVMGAAYLVALACAPALSLRAVMLAVVLANVGFTLGPTIVSTDVFGYIAYAREIALHGLNPYVSAPISLGHDDLLQFVYWKHQPSPYGPLFSVATAPLGLLSPGAALWVFKAAAGLAGVALAWLVAGLARRRQLDPARAAIFAGLNPVLLLYAVSGAHNDLLAAALVACALALVLRGREREGAFLAVAAAAVKLTVGLALPFIVLASAGRRRAAAAAALAAAAVAVVALALFGTSLFDQLQRISSDPLFDTVYSGPDRLAQALGTHITTGVRIACTGTAAILVLGALAWVRRGGDAITAAGWAFLAMIASIASLAPWYLVWVLPFAALARGRALRVATVLATAYLIVFHLPLLGGEPWLSQAGASSYGAGAGIASLGPRVGAARAASERGHARPSDRPLSRAA